MQHFYESWLDLAYLANYTLLVWVHYLEINAITSVWNKT